MFALSKVLLLSRQVGAEHFQAWLSCFLQVDCIGVLEPILRINVSRFMSIILSEVPNIFLGNSHFLSGEYSFILSIIQSIF